jgi:hypothetical protein
MIFMHRLHNSLVTGVQQQSIGWKHAVAAADVYIKASLLISKQRTNQVSEPKETHVNEWSTLALVHVFYTSINMSITCAALLKMTWTQLILVTLTYNACLFFTSVGVAAPPSGDSHQDRGHVFALHDTRMLLVNKGSRRIEWFKTSKFGSQEIRHSRTHGHMRFYQSNLERPGQPSSK